MALFGSLEKILFPTLARQEASRRDTQRVPMLFTHFCAVSEGRWVPACRAQAEWLRRLPRGPGAVDEGPTDLPPGGA